MTQSEEKEIKRVCGENYEESDIPAYIRQRDEKLTSLPDEDESEEDLDKDNWAELHGATQDENGEWIV